MTKSFTKKTIGARELFFYFHEPADERGPVPIVLLHGENAENFAPVLEKILTQKERIPQGFVAAGISADWNREFSPWPAAAAFKKGEDFGGEADSYLQEVAEEILPKIKSIFPQTQGGAVCSMGYSLGGLVTLYGLFKFAVFDRAASASGSLWYPGWADFVQKNRPQNPGAKVYLSLGRGEEKTKNPLMAKVLQATETTQSSLQNALQSPVPLVLHDGGHFTEVPMRKEQALLWLLQK